MDPRQIIDSAPLLLGVAIIGLLGFIILLAVGLNLWSRERKPKDDTGAPVTANEDKKPGFQLSMPVAVTERLAPRAAPADPANHEVLRVLRDKLTGRVLVEISGKRYAEMSDVKESDVRRALLLTMRDLQEFIGMSAAIVGATMVTPPVTLSATTEAQANPSLGGNPPVQLNAAPLPKAPTNEAAAPLRAPSMNLFKQIAITRELSAKELPPIKLLAEQIDEVLQHIIAGTPFAAQHLHVASGPNNGVIFEVGPQVYDAVDQIPDATLQTVFREAIRRWEQQQ
ncbi:MAG: hypothetical protein ACT4QE_18520 [Anaerolineales bacterium]